MMIAGDDTQAAGLDVLIPLQKAAQILGVKQTKFYELIALGKIEARKIGRSSLVPASSLRAYMEGLPRLVAKLPNPKR